MVQILESLRNDPHYLADAFARVHTIKGVEKDGFYFINLCRTITFSIFRGCINPMDQILFYQLLIEMCNFQSRLAIAKAKENARVKYPPLFALFIRAMIRFTPTWNFFQTYLQSIVCELFTKIEYASASQRKNVIKESAESFIKQCIALEKHIPLFLRILIHSTWKFTTEQDVKDFHKFHLMSDVLFDNFFLCCIESPSVYSGLNMIGLQHALQSIPQFKATIIEMLQPENTELVQFLERLKSDTSPLTHGLQRELDNPIYLHPACRRILISKSQFMMIIEMLQHTLQVVIPELPVSKLWKNSDSFRQDLDKFIDQELQTDNSAFQKINSSALLDILLRARKRQLSSESAIKGNSALSELKKQMINLLASFSYIPVGSDLASTMQNMLSYCILHSSSPKSAQIHHIFDKILQMSEADQIKFLVKIRDELDLKKKQPRQKVEILTLDWLQEYFYQASSFKKRWEAYLNTIKVETFDQIIYNNMKLEFVPLYVKTFQGKMNCECSIMQKITCETCGMKSSFVKEFLGRVLAKMKDSILWKKFSDEHLVEAYHQVQHNLLDYLYDWTYSYVKEDHILEEELKKVELTPELFQIPAKHLNTQPWDLVATELNQCNSYRSPYLKFRCISKSWEVLSSLMALVDDEGVDACYAVMAYIICTHRIKHIFSNVHYIMLYTQLNDSESARLLAFRVVLKAIRQTLTNLLQNSNK